MRRSLPLLACAILAAASAQDRQVVENASGALTFDRGVLVGARNKLTRETYTTDRRADRLTGLLHGAEQTPEWADAAGSGPAKPGGIAFEAKLGEGDTLSTTVRADTTDADFVVRQTGRGTGGLYACQWGAAGLSDEQVSLIVPAWSGVRLGRGSPAVDTYLEWPSVWEARLVIAQGRQGGLWIRADDPDERYKGLYLRHRGGLFDLGLRTCNEAPLDAQRSVESVVWRIGFYRGDWRVPARRYRDWMARTAGATLAAKRKPAWADGIRSVVILPTGRGGSQNEARAVLQKLTEWITPGRTLLYTPDWRHDGYDLNYPDYTAHDGYRELVEFAHRLGYRVMPHTCYYGASLDNPDYERLEPYHLRDLRGNLITYLWDFADPAPRIAMLHPGARAWRELYVARCRAIAE
ncbi:MAG: hypothetical protein HYU66_09525, partial [Armatimonadetes bacterium]|nr:hypothetical protein [Armatimonadota bacterium]